MRYLVTNQRALFDNSTIAEEYRYEIISPQECLARIDSLMIVGLDTETTGFDPYTKKILCLQIGNRENQYVIDNTVDIQLFKPFLEDRRRLFLLHNAKFDLRFFLHQRIVITNVFDTYLAERLLYLGYPPGMHEMSLNACCQRYLGVTLEKEIRGIIHREGLSARVIRYAARDVEYSEDIYDAQQIELTKKDLIRAIEVENKFVVVLAYIEYSGIKLDAEKWQTKMASDKLALDKARLELDEWVLNNGDKRFIYQDLQGDLFTGYSKVKCGIMWSSPLQVIPFFESLGFNLATKDKKTGTMKKSVEAKLIEPQQDLSPVAKLYLAYKQADKVVSTYGQSFIDQINPVTGRIHTQFNQLMDTTRLSSGGKDKDTNTETINLQNIPADELTRACFVSEPGNILIDCDYTAQEDLIFTELSREQKLIEFYNSPDKRDGHSFVAKMCFPTELADIPESDVKEKRHDLRGLAKKAKFSIHYGGNGSTIARNLRLPLEVGNSIEKSYLKSFPGIDAYFKKVKRDAWEHGYILLSAVTGHKHYIYNWQEIKDFEKTLTKEFWDIYRYEKEIKSTYFETELSPKIKKYMQSKGEVDRHALNYPVQGSSAILTKIAAVFFFEALRRNNLLFKVWICNAVHDELLVECEESLSQVVAIKLQQCMEHAGTIFCNVVTLKAIPEIATFWKH